MTLLSLGSKRKRLGKGLYHEATSCQMCKNVCYVVQGGGTVNMFLQYMHPWQCHPKADAVRIQQNVFYLYSLFYNYSQHIFFQMQSM